MTDLPRSDELAQLHAEVAALRASIDRPRRRFPRRVLPLTIATLLVALMPLSTLAANPFFSDLNAAAPVHRPNIQAIGNVGITTGFEDPADPTARLYDPKGLVTREEMASFLARTAGLGGNPPVANALIATNANAAISANHATSADTATTVGGRAPNGLIRAASATAARVDVVPQSLLTVTTLLPSNPAPTTWPSSAPP